MPYLQGSVNDSIQAFASAVGTRAPDRRETVKTCSLPQSPPEPAPIWHLQLLQMPRWLLSWRAAVPPGPFRLFPRASPSSSGCLCHQEEKKQLVTHGAQVPSIRTTTFRGN